MTAIDHASIDTQVPQLPDGEYDSSYSQELWFRIFIYFVLVFMVAAAILFMTKIAKRVNRRITRFLMELGGDHRM